jgi:predicted transcriptional regulator
MDTPQDKFADLLLGPDLTKLSPPELKTFVSIISILWPTKKDEGEILHKDIARKANLSHVTVLSAIKDLSNHGLITVHRSSKRGKVNSYRLRKPLFEEGTKGSLVEEAIESVPPELVEQELRRQMHQRWMAENPLSQRRALFPAGQMSQYSLDRYFEENIWQPFRQELEDVDLTHELEKLRARPK